MSKLIAALLTGLFATTVFAQTTAPAATTPAATATTHAKKKMGMHKKMAPKTTVAPAVAAPKQ